VGVFLVNFLLVFFGFVWFILRSEVRNLIPCVVGHLLAVGDTSVDLSGVGNVGPSVLRVDG